MKKLSFFKKLGLGLATSAAILPISLVATSCSQNSILSRYITFKNMKNDINGDTPEDYVYSKMKTGRFSSDDLLLGSKNFCGGNYILFTGSNVFPATRKFFMQDTGPRNVDAWFSVAYSKSSYLYQDIQKYPQENIEKFEVNFGFTAYIDNFDCNTFYDGKGRQIYPTTNHTDSTKMLSTVGPFDKWKEQGIIDESKKLTEEIWHEQGHTSWKWDEDIEDSDYIRQDSFAKAYRAFCRRGAIMFPTTDERTQTFDVSDDNKVSLMVIYKKGKLVEITTIPDKKNDSITPIDDKESTTVLGAINKWFVDYEED
ncbi:MAG: Vmc-like lipoprotein signal peptide domain-containing protein [Mycoplasmoidaceae bacterium]